MRESSLIKISAILPTHLVDLVEGYLHETAPNPWYIDVNKLSNQATLVGVFSNSKELDYAKSALYEEIPSSSLGDFSHDEIRDEDWKNSYKKHFKPWTYKEFHLIPLWLKNNFVVPQDQHALYLDPGMAFGTGNHETTRLCLEFLLELQQNEFQRQCLIDIGCGSGILTLAASLLGFDRVLGVDIDEDAVRIAKENASFNGLQNKTNFEVMNLDNPQIKKTKSDCILVNIQTDVLVRNANNILRFLKANGCIVLSGILCHEIDHLLQGFRKEIGTASHTVETRIKGEWIAAKISF